MKISIIAQRTSNRNFRESPSSRKYNRRQAAHRLIHCKPFIPFIWSKKISQATKIHKYKHSNIKLVFVSLRLELRNSHWYISNGMKLQLVFNFQKNFTVSSKTYLWYKSNWNETPGRKLNFYVAMYSKFVRTK